MIEKVFQNRVPAYPGRVRLTHVNGDLYQIERADSPTVQGTPLNKAYFDSIVQSRLTGRLYTPSVVRSVLTSATGSTNLLPSSGWVEESYTEFTSGSYKLTSSYPDYPNLADHAFDGSDSTYWAAESDTGETWIAVDFGSRIVVNSLRVNWFSYSYDSFSVKFQGSNGGAWTDIATKTGNTDGAEDWTFNNTAEYSRYRLLFTQGTENTMRLYEWAITAWTANVYRNVFTVASGLPTEWTVGQLLLIQTPNAINTVGVLDNTLNGVMVNTILQPGKRYELRYTGTSFVAKEG